MQNNNAKKSDNNNVKGFGDHTPFFFTIEVNYNTIRRAKERKANSNASR